ncbi:sugar transporter [Streptomyces alboflavus]|uniref:Sugar transporter n=1 Tax=Streptomyces alboflavus TaxID=67267 RepID=A0A1Z1WQX3_9ACTN|nr:sugar transporter [Streptomyces alboflavus]
MAVVAALMLGAFAFNTTENLPIGVLKLMSDDMDVSLAAVGLLVSGYGLTVAVVSVPIAQLTRSVPRRLVLCLLLAGSSWRAWSRRWSPRTGCCWSAGW